MRGRTRDRAADAAVCENWQEAELAAPEGMQLDSVQAGAGAFAVGNGTSASFSTSVVVWKGEQVLARLSYSRNTVYAADVNSSGG